MHLVTAVAPGEAPLLLSYLSSTLLAGLSYQDYIFLSYSGIFPLYFKAVVKNLLLILLLEAFLTLKFSTCNGVIVIGESRLGSGQQCGSNPELRDKALHRESTP